MNSAAAATQWPLVTLAIPTYNRPELLARALQCAVDQRYPELEILVADNASPGTGTIDVIENFRRNDARIKVFRHPQNLGVLRNLLFLLEQARGEYFLWLADDDALSAGYVEALAGALRSDARVACAFCRYRHIAPDGTETIRRRGFAQPAAWRRALGYLMAPDDGFFYGLHRTALLRASAFRPWWWPNRGIATNWAYPFLFNVILTGTVSIVDDDSVEWINDERAAKSYAVGGSLFGIFQFVVLRLNVHCEYARRAFVQSGILLASWVALLGCVALLRDYGMYGARLAVQVARRIFRRRN